MSQDNQNRSLVLGLGVMLAAVLGVIYLFPASSLGFWEPWETTLATMGRSIAEGSINAFAPLDADGALIAKPWLQTTLLSLGYKIGGGSEFGFRLPFAALNLLTALFAFGVFTRIFGATRAFLAGLLFGLTPVVFLSSVNLAGEAFLIAPTSLAVLAGIALISDDDPERRNPGMIVALGVFLALCVWGRGIVGLAIPLATIALSSVALMREEAKALSTTALVSAAALLAGGVLWAVIPYLSGGWEEARNIIAVVVAIILPTSVLIGAAARGPAAKLFHPIATPLAAVVFVALVAAPMLAFLGNLPEATGEDAMGPLGSALHFLLYNSFLTSRSIPDHVTYDILMRFVGYGVYPMVVLVPFGMGYLFHTSRTDVDDTDDLGSGQRSAKIVLAVWATVGFGVIALATSLSGHIVFPIALPLMAAVALSVTDGAFLRWLKTNRTAFYAAGIAALAILAMTSKDVRGTFDDEMGRPGPHVIFEFLLVDGGVEFPADYILWHINLFFAAWALSLILIFGDAIQNVRDMGAAMRRMPDADFIVWRIIFYVPVRLARLAGPLVESVCNTFDKVWSTVTFGVRSPVLGIAAFTLVTSVWVFHLAAVDVPTVSNHFSQKGLLETYDELAEEGQPLHTAGIAATDTSYYLGADSVERLPRVADVADLFCGATGRVFVIVPTDSLGEAYYNVRTHEDEACPDLQLFVVDARSNRYVLATNELHEGETNQGAIAENVFSFDTLPETVTRFEDGVTVDGKLRLVASEITPSELSSGEFEVTTYWEVTDRFTGNYEIFVHVDFGGNRINGDHDPVDGAYPMRYWVPGDIVRDRLTLEVSRADRRGIYDVWLGFFRGDDRLVVDPPRGDNRINVGQLGVRAEVEEDE